MTITMLVENTTSQGSIGAQHGLSLFIETGGTHILFDMGSDDLFAKNARVLGIDLASVDLAVLSHGHWDHGGGIAAFFALNDHAPLYVRRGAFGPFYSLHDDGVYHRAGLDHALSDHERIILTDGERSLGEGITLFGDVADIHGVPRGNQTLVEKVGDEYGVDSFFHEQYLAIEEGKTLVLITGCSHRGIANILEAFHTRWNRWPDTVIGGFHLMDYTREDEAELGEIAEYLLSTKALFHTCHCTGQESYGVLKKIMGDSLHWASGAMTYTIEERVK